MLIVFHYCRRRVTFVEASVLALSVIVFAVAFVTVRTHTYARHGVDVEVLEDEEWDTATISQKYFRDQNYLDTFAVLIDDMPTRFPFQYGRTFAYLAAFPIPRKIWPDKPPAYEGRLYADVYFQGSGRPPGFAGVMYMNFHFLGIVIGFALLGQLHRYFYRYLKENISNPACVCFYAAGVLFLAEFTNVGLTQWILHMSGVFAAVWFCTAAKKEKTYDLLARHPRVALGARS
jgi:hypothetical protein